MSLENRNAESMREQLRQWEARIQLLESHAASTNTLLETLKLKNEMLERELIKKMLEGRGSGPTG